MSQKTGLHDADYPPIGRGGVSVVWWISLVMAMLGGSGWMATALPSDVYLIRHAEKPEDPAELHLNEAGRARSQALVPYLSRLLGMETNHASVVLVATRPTRHGHGARPHETLAPFSQRWKSPVHTPFLAEEHSRLAEHIRSSSEWSGRKVVVCWVHESLPSLAAELGVTTAPAHWKGSDYDQVWWIHYDAQGTPTFKILHQPAVGKGTAWMSP